MARLEQPASQRNDRQFVFKRYYRLRGLERHYGSGLETDALAYWHADAGTVKVQAGGGMTFRFGYNLGNTSPENSIRGATSAAPPSFTTVLLFPTGAITGIFTRRRAPWRMICIWTAPFSIPPRIT